MALLQQLLLRLQSGDEKALKALMDELSEGLTLFAIGLVKNLELAEEIVSETFVKLWRKRNSLNELNDIRSYLFIVTRNACITHLRKSKTEILSIDAIDDFQLPDINQSEEEEFREGALKQIYDAIETLPPKCKMAFSLAKIQGLKYKEISDIMGISVNTVNNHIARALELIVEVISERNNQSSTSTKKLISFMLAISL